jgi:SpoVK/Ycf46/Vps4 family AAA+-type ATPase
MTKPPITSVPKSDRSSARLTAKDLTQVRKIAGALRAQAGRRSPLLFTGSNASAAAEAQAKELRRDLYRIDLSAVVGKYIGETGKNLDRAFGEAERAGAILFFDEADALFGKRTDVKDSHDRYANLDVGYVLQRLEAFGGIAIVAAKSNAVLPASMLRRFSVYRFPP